MANKIYVNAETAILYGSEVGDDVAWSTESVANNAGRQSAFHDRGAVPRSAQHKWRFWTQCQATPTVGNIMENYAKTGGSETATPDHPDNDDGTGDAAVSAEDKLRNLHFIGAAIVDEAAANIEYVSSGELRILARHIAFVMWNETGATTTTDAAETKLRLTPIPDEVQ